ncbi:MAG TPA: hypothetical protein VHS54_02220 [Jatrophihabitans sp.]|nr:hypothetical protein [Jatrophihabitans sp.]
MSPGYFAVDRVRIVEVIATAPTVLIWRDRRELTPFIERHPPIKERALEGLASNTRWQTILVSSLATNRRRTDSFCDFWNSSIRAPSVEPDPRSRRRSHSRCSRR